MSELDAIAAGAVTGLTVAAAADEALEGKKHPRAGQCHNCHAALAGPFCHACGQKSGHLHKPIWELGEDFLHTIVHWDGRLLVTLRAMLFAPARHLNDWINGRQMRHMPPIRMFVFISLLLLLMLSFSDVVLFRLESPKRTASQIAQMDEMDKTAIDCVLEAASPGSSKELEDCPADSSSLMKWQGRFLAIDDPATALQGNPLGNNFTSLVVNGQDRSDKISVIRQQLDNFLKHPKQFNDFVGHSVTKFMLVAVPVHTLLQAFFQIRRKRYFIEHLLFSLQSHTVLFLLLLVATMIAWVSRGLVDGDWLMGGLFAAYAVHLLAAMHHFYGQSWVRTGFKYLTIGFFYFLFMIIIGSMLMGRALDKMEGGPGSVTIH